MCLRALFVTEIRSVLQCCSFEGKHSHETHRQVSFRIVIKHTIVKKYILLLNICIMHC